MRERVKMVPITEIQVLIYEFRGPLSLVYLGKGHEITPRIMQNTPPQNPILHYPVLEPPFWAISSQSPSYGKWVGVIPRGRYVGCWKFKVSVDSQ